MPGLFSGFWKSILKRLADKPHAINSRLVQLIRDSQGLLAHMLLIEGETGPHEKQRLKSLIEGFQELRQRALAVKAAATSPRAGEPAQPPAPGTCPSPLPKSSPHGFYQSRTKFRSRNSWN